MMECVLVSRDDQGITLDRSLRLDFRQSCAFVLLFLSATRADISGLAASSERERGVARVKSSLCVRTHTRAGQARH